MADRNDITAAAERLEALNCALFVRGLDSEYLIVLGDGSVDRNGAILIGNAELLARIDELEEIQRATGGLRQRAAALAAGEAAPSKRPPPTFVCPGPASTSSDLRIPPYRLAYAKPDLDDNLQFSDCMLMALHNARTLLLAHSEAEDSGLEDASSLALLARHEVEDAMAVIDAWYKRKKP